MGLYSYHYHNQQHTKKIHEQRITGILVRAVAVLSTFFIFLLTSLIIRNLKSDYITPVSASTPNQVTTFSQDEVGQIQSSIQPRQTRLPQSSNETIVQYNNTTITPTSTPTLTPPVPTQTLKTTKNLYTIAIIGDSMVDTMGEVLEYLDAALKKKYPDTKFLLYNYGTGAQNIEMGLARFGSHFKYQDRDYPSLPELKPDILIVASFSYNPFTPHDRDRHWLTLTKLVQEAKQYTPQVYMLAEIAPLRKDFGKGPNGVNWSDDSNFEHSGRIIEQLQNAIGLSSTLNVPLIDAFTPSLDGSKIQGQAKYVNPSDGIHPSVEGHRFMADKIAESIKLQ